MTETRAIYETGLRAQALAAFERADEEIRERDERRREQEYERAKGALAAILNDRFGVTDLVWTGRMKGDQAIPRAIVDEMLFEVGDARRSLHLVRLCKACGCDLYSDDIQTVHDLGYYLQPNWPRWQDCKGNQRERAEEEGASSPPPDKEPWDFMAQVDPYNRVVIGELDGDHGAFHIRLDKNLAFGLLAMGAWAYSRLESQRGLEQLLAAAKGLEPEENHQQVAPAEPGKKRKR